MKYDVIIIGAGASGLVTAIVSARRGKKVLILEKNNKIGKKLLATGNGKCNIANQKPLPNRFYSKNPDFIHKVLEGFDYRAIKLFFKSIGLELIEAKEGKAFPMSLQASSVVELLLCECEQLAVEILLERAVNKIEKKGKNYAVHHNNRILTCEQLVLATGHQSAPQLGGVRDGLEFAKNLGHQIVPSFPTLVQLTSPQEGLKEMAGVKIYSKVSFKSKKGLIQKEGDVLFTNYGISGLAILDISRFVLEELHFQKNISLSIDLMPKMSHEQLLSLFKKSLSKKSTKALEIWLQGFINKKLIPPILKALKLQNQTVASISSNMDAVKKIVDSIKSFPFIVDGSKGYKGAEVATGGVNTREINVNTMESKISKGFYLVGEVIDVDGDRGGFNLHFAWVSALRAGEAV